MTTGEDSPTPGTHGQRRWPRLATAMAMVAPAMVTLAVSGCGSSAPVSRLGFSPSPGSPVASPRTQISIRGAVPSQLHDLTVIGSRSGSHAGRLVAQPGGLGTSFLPDRPFDPGERVRVSLRDGAAKRPTSLRFTIARQVPVPVRAGPPGKPTRPGQVQSFHSAPGLRPPTVTVTARSTAAAEGDIFLGPANKLGQAGPMILDGQGRLIWFDPLPGKDQAFNVSEQRYEGRPVLAWWQGIVSTRGYGVGEDVIYDAHYRQIATVRAAEGYAADLHDFTLTPQGTALITAYDPVRMDLRSVGGPRNGTVLDGVVQEIDVRTGLVLFEWHSVGNVPLSDSYSKPAKGGLFDYFHINSVALAPDGNLIVSARNTWTVYEISTHTGKIMWQLGGKHSSFAMGPGTQFAYQHDARFQGDDTITLFNNGASPKVQPQSAGLQIRLDTKAMQATLVRRWTYPGGLLAGSQGNVQTLPNGDRFVGWGAQPNLTEFSAGGRVLFDAALAAPDTSYRAYRYPWSATPPGRPAAAATAAPGGRLVVYASWNGASAIARWRILAGPSPRALKPVTEVPRAGFETSATIFSNAAYVSVEAESASGAVLGSSKAVRPS
ncbi:MAG: arylsulfotransferase family protein [Solirubrobacteraceae bacterium]